MHKLAPEQKLDAVWLEPRPGRLGTNLTVAVLSLCLALVASEIGVRLLPLPVVERIRARQDVEKQIDEVHPRGIYQVREDDLWTLTPNFAGRFRKDDFDIAVWANDRGLRDKVYGSKKQKTFRILGLGDSFAFGWGVELKESFYKQLEAKLPEPAEVINAGIPGFGTYEALRLLETDGLSYEPDLVLLAFYEGNDYKNNGAAPRQREIRDGYLKDISVKQHPGWLGMLSKHSVLAALLEAKFSNFVQKRRFPEQVKRTKQYLHEMKTLLDAQNIPFAVVFIPDQDPAFYGRPEILRAYDRLASGMDLFKARQELERFAQEQGIPFLVLSRLFQDHEVAKELRLKDTHFNAQGHDLAADEIYEFLLRAELV